MFPVKIKDDIPIEYVKIQSLSVRGQLGPMTVWVAGIKAASPQENNFYHYHTRPDAPHGRQQQQQVLKYSKTWHKVYQRVHAPSMHRYVSFKISPVTLKPGESCVFYIHSSQRSDQSIAYENAQKPITFQDDVISIYAGRSHLSTRPFGSLNIWGYPGAWKDDRAFVGQLRYCVTNISWKPNIHVHFGQAYDQMVLTLLLCRRRSKSPISLLSDDNIFLILQMCGYNWASNSSFFASNKKKRKQSRLGKLIKLQKKKFPLHHGSCLPWRVLFHLRN